MNRVVKSAYFSSNSTVKPAHLHDCHQLIYVKKGEVKFNTLQGILNVGEGNLVFFNHLTEHSIHSVSGNYERYILSIEPQYHSAEMIFNKIFMLIFSNSLIGNYVLDFKSNAREFESLLNSIVSESCSDNSLKNEMVETLFQHCLIMIYRLFPQNFKMINEKHFDVVRKIQKLFEFHPEKQYSLELISREYNMSISSLSHSFKKLTGTSVINYLNFCRLDKAKLLLSESNMSISEVYESCGFSDGSNFSRLFRQNTGMSPTEYRYKKEEIYI